MPTSRPSLLRGRNGQRLCPIHVGGASSGAVGNLAVKATANRASLDLGLDLTYYDEVLGRAPAQACRANRVGIEAAGIEANIVDAGLRRLTPGAVVIYHTHSAGVIARGLAATVDAGVSTMAYLIVQFPSSDVYAIAATLRPTTRHEHTLAALLMAELAASAAPGQYAINTGRYVLTQSVERVLRGLFAGHHQRALMPLLTGAELGVHPFEVSVNAKPMLPMLVTESRFGAGDPQQLVDAATAEHPEVLEHGRGYVHAELVPGGMHFHETYVRPGGGGLQVVNTRVVQRVSRTGRLATKD